MIIKIVGSGSAGNHMAYALRNLSNHIVLTDISKKALIRSKYQIYLPRYKKWNKNINLKIEGKDSNTQYDAIVIASPPHTHCSLIKKNIKKSKIFLIEKPICEPKLKTINELEKIIYENKEKIFLCGYNHRLFPSTILLKKLFLKQKKNFVSMEIKFKENTEGFLKAHNWYKSLAESYLSNTTKGGGALAEHSHGINLCQYLVNDFSNFRLINKDINFFKFKNSNYDESSNLIFSKKNKIINIFQNFTSKPTEKELIINGINYFIKLIYNYKNSNDQIIYYNKKNSIKKVYNFKKKRADDFFYEAKHLIKIIKNKNDKKAISILSAKEALKTIKLVNKVINEKKN
jgi:predicted dehydrogenase